MIRLNAQQARGGSVYLAQDNNAGPRSLNYFYFIYMLNRIIAVRVPFASLSENWIKGVK